MREPSSDEPARLLHEGEFLRLLRRRHWEYVERTNSRGVAILVALTPERRLLLVEQYRLPVQRSVIELPAGLVGDVADGETLHEAANRELVEETGYAAGEIEIACTGPVTAGLSNEQTTFCIARDLSREGPGGGDHTEDIRVHEVPLADVVSWLGAASRRAQIDPKIYIGLWLLRERAGQS